VIAPAAIVTVAGVVAAALLEDNVTTAPVGGAGESSVIAAVEVAPEKTEAGLSVKFDMETGLVTVNTADRC